jgi:hypothetical protein
MGEGGILQSSGLRIGRNLIAVILCLTAGGCVALPEEWTPVEKRHIDAKSLSAELSNDRAICEDEIKANLAASNQTTIWGPTEDAKSIYTECMVRHGYRPGK